MKPLRIAIAATLAATVMLALVPAAQAGKQECYQPDGLIKGIGTDAFVGGDIYNADGAGQTKTRRARPGNSDTYRVRLENDGSDCSDDFDIVGDGASAGFMVKYFADGVDITDEVVGGTYSTDSVPLGGNTNIKVWIKASKGANPGSAEAVAITATADGQQPNAPTPLSELEVSDTVVARLEVTGTAGNQGGA